MQPPFFTAVDLTYGVVCCFQCGDYVYDRELETIAQKHQTKASLSLGLGQVYHSWEPSEEEIELLKKHTRRKKITDSATIGSLFLKINYPIFYLNSMFHSWQDSEV